MMVRAFLLTICVLLLTQGCYSQRRQSRPATLFLWDGDREPSGDLGQIVTDRPDFTEASSTVGLGVAQIETGYTFTSNYDSRVHSWGELLLRYGVLVNWLELRLGATPVSERQLAANRTTSGFEDLYIGSKVALTKQDRLLPETAVIFQMTVPSGGGAFTADRVLPGVNLLYGWDITEELSFAGSTQFNSSVDDSLRRYDETAQSLTIGRSLSDRYGSYLEWFAFFPHSAIDATPSHYLNGGFTFLMTDGMQLDVRAGKGLNDESDDYAIGTGISVRFK